LATKAIIASAILRAGNAGEIDAVFRNLSEQGIGALLVDADPLFYTERNRVAVLAERAAVPAIYQVREIVEAGGLMSYGANLVDVFRLVGNYAGRILNGEKPAQLPVQQPTRFELVLNLKTAKALNLEVPPALLALADEVIE
jgi:putative tryptophan/tyrosine transport system substrate-binding protein